MTLLDEAKAHRKAGRLGDAAVALRAAVRSAPMDPEVWFQGGTLAIKLRDFGFAASLFDLCAKLVPTDAQAAYNLGYCRFRMGEPESAVEAYEEAVARDPGFVRAQIGLGQMLHIVGRNEAGRVAFERALALPAPSRADDQELRALVRIVRGEFAQGWAEFDRQWSARHDDVFTRFRSWSGESASHDTLGLTVDGGFGDTILFIRFASEARRRVQRVVGVLEPALRRLLSGTTGLDATVSSLDELPAGSRVSGLWTLPRKLGTTPETIPMTVPYIHAPETGPVLPPSKRLRVGIVWYGGADCAHDFDRSCPDLNLLAEMFTVPGVEWHHLQPSSDRTVQGDRFGIQAMPPVSDFADTAFVIRQLDLVITVDTAIANLSAALGVPTWIMIPTIPEFRWPLGAERSPWYPAARLFRRTQTRAWPEAGAAVAAQLAKRVADGVDPDLPDYRRLDVSP